ncbi:MAG: hypothetical protein WCS03_12285 [Bacteroidota bacterium]
MKTKLILILISLIYACSTTTKEKTISIIDNWDSRAQDNIESHKDKEVKISRMHIRDKEGKFYVAFMYRIDNNKLRVYPYFISAKEDYDKATYKWINDTTLTFKLLNSSKKLSEAFIMTGNGSRLQLSKE